MFRTRYNISPHFIDELGGIKTDFLFTIGTIQSNCIFIYIYIYMFIYIYIFIYLPPVQYGHDPLVTVPRSYHALPPPCTHRRALFTTGTIRSQRSRWCTKHSRQSSCCCRRQIISVRDLGVHRAFLCVVCVKYIDLVSLGAGEQGLWI